MESRAPHFLLVMSGRLGEVEVSKTCTYEPDATWAGTSNRFRAPNTAPLPPHLGANPKTSGTTMFPYTLTGDKTLRSLSHPFKNTLKTVASSPRHSPPTVAERTRLVSRSITLEGSNILQPRPICTAVRPRPSSRPTFETFPMAPGSPSFRCMPPSPRSCCFRSRSLCLQSLHPGLWNL